MASFTKNRSAHCDNLSTHDADVFTKVDRSLCYDLIEEMHERYAAALRRCASAKTRESPNSAGERSNSEGERSNSEGDRSK